MLSYSRLGHPIMSLATVCCRCRLTRSRLCITIWLRPPQKSSDHLEGPAAMHWFAVETAPWLFTSWMWCSRSSLRRKRSSKSILRVIVENFYRLVALGPLEWVATTAVRISRNGPSRGGNSWASAAPPSLINLETARGLAATITGAFRTGHGADADYGWLGRRVWHDGADAEDEMHFQEYLMRRRCHTNGETHYTPGALAGDCRSERVSSNCESGFASRSRRTCFDFAGRESGARASRQSSGLKRREVSLRRL